MSCHTEREDQAVKASEWLRTADLGDVAAALQTAAFDMVQRGTTPDAAQHLYEASSLLRAAGRAKDGASQRRTYCMFCHGVTMGEPPLATCQWPSGHLDEAMKPYVAPPPLAPVGALVTFADRYAGSAWYAGADLARDGEGVPQRRLIVSHWEGTVPPADAAPWQGFAVEFKAIARRGF
jgi:hypothetical protein